MAKPGSKLAVYNVYRFRQRPTQHPERVWQGEARSKAHAVHLASGDGRIKHTKGLFARLVRNDEYVADPRTVIAYQVIRSHKEEAEARKRQRLARAIREAPKGFGAAVIAKRTKPRFGKLGAASKVTRLDPKTLEPIPEA